MKYLAVFLEWSCIYYAINVKMPTIVGILTFMSMINFMLSWVKHEKRFFPRGLVYHRRC